MGVVCALSFGLDCGVGKRGMFQSMGWVAGAVYIELRWEVGQFRWTTELCRLCPRGGRACGDGGLIGMIFVTT